MSKNRKHLFFLSVILIIGLLTISLALIKPSIQSPDAGDNWSSNEDITFNATYLWLTESDRSIAVTNFGYVHIVYSANISNGAGSSEIIHVTNTSSGWVAANVSKFNQSSVGSYDPVIAVDSTGAVHTVWRVYNASSNKQLLFYANRTSTTWSTPINITTGDRSALWPTIVMDSHDTLHVAYWDATYRAIYYLNKTADGEWSTPVAITKNIVVQTLTEHGLSITADIYDKLYVAFAGYSALTSYWSEVYVINNTIGAWSTPYNVSRDTTTTNLHDIEPSIDTYSGKVINIAWAVKLTSSSNIVGVKYANYTNGAWSSPVYINTTTTNIGTPSLKADFNDKAHIVFEQQGINFKDIFYINNTMGYFGNIVNVTKTLGSNDQQPHITIDTNGYAHIFYRSYIGGVPRFYYIYTTEAVGPAATAPNIHGPSNMHVVWGETIPTLHYNITSNRVTDGKYNLWTNTTSGYSLVSSGEWINGSTLSIDISNFDVGVHEILMNAYNRFFRTSSQSFLLYVAAPQPAVTGPNDFNYTIGNANPQLTWRITSPYYPSGDYVVYLNGTAIHADTWSNNTDIVLTISGLNQPGVANVTMVVTDPYGNTVTHQVDITVESEATPPAPPATDMTVPIIIGVAVGVVAVAGVAFYMLKIRA